LIHFYKREVGLAVLGGLQHTKNSQNEFR